MTKATVVIITLVVYKLLLVGIGLWASKKTKSPDDFLLAGRGLGPVIAALSYSSSASSAWTLLGLSGMAYLMGLSSLWIAVGSLTGMVVAWYWIAPRLMQSSKINDQVTVTDFLIKDVTGVLRKPAVWLISAIIIFSFVFYIAAQFQGAGSTFASVFGFSNSQSIIMGAVIIMLYTLLGGFWAVSMTDSVQGALMAVTAIILPLAALIEVGGLQSFVSALQQTASPEQLSFTASNAGFYALGAIFGSMAIGIGTFGQPHLLVRFMALRDSKALQQARVIAVVWYLIVFLGMWFVGLVGHILHANVTNPETIFFVLTESLFTPVLAAILLTAVLSAIMSTADSQLLVVASVIAHDLGLGGRDHVLLTARLSVIVLVVVAVLVSIYLPERIFDRVLFAWIALGSAFGPLVFFRLANIPVKSVGVFVSILVGFLSAVLLYLIPDIYQLIERLLPFVLALAVLGLFRQKMVV